MSTRTRIQVRQVVTINPGDVTKQLKQFLADKDAFTERFNMETTYPGIGNSKEMLTAFTKSKLYKSINEFVKKYSEQESKKVTELQKLYEDEITSIITNNGLTVANKLEKLNKLIEVYAEVLNQIRRAWKYEPKWRNKTSMNTFEYYYHKGYESILSANEFKKVEADMAELHSLFERGELDDVQYSNQVYEKYELLNKINVDFAFVDLLRHGYENPLLVKEAMYNGLNARVNRQLHRLSSISYISSNREDIRVSGKKKQKKRSVGRNRTKKKKRSLS